MKTILILEDNDERIAAFQKAVAALGDGFDLKVWRDAPSMRTECEAYFPTAALISLDHDLNPMPGATVDPGTGVDVARFLGDFMPVCPVLIHSSNTDRVYSMHNELRFAGWMVDRVGPLDADWIETSWLRRARELLAHQPNTWSANLPSDHTARVHLLDAALDELPLAMNVYGWSRTVIPNYNVLFESYMIGRQVPRISDSLKVEPFNFEHCSLLRLGILKLSLHNSHLPAADLDCFPSGLSGLNHFLQLAIINKSGGNHGGRGNDADKKSGAWRSGFVRFFGLFILIIGGCLICYGWPRRPIAFIVGCILTGYGTIVFIIQDWFLLTVH